MRYTCSDCNETFSAAKKPKNCPFCLSENLRYDGKSREKAIELIEYSNQLTSQIEELMEKFKPIYLERECALNTLRVYKQRGIITEEEMPKIERQNIQKEIVKYRKKRKVE